MLAAQELVKLEKDRANYWDTLADAYHAEAQKPLAIMMCRRALVLSRDPANREALGANLRRFERGDTDRRAFDRKPVLKAMMELLPQR